MGTQRRTYGVEMEHESARDIRGMFFSAYTGLREWHKNARKMVAQGVQSVRTVLGRIQRLPKGAETKWPRFTALVNTPVQGGSADALKQAMVGLSGQLPPGAGIVSTVHDELVVEAPLKNVEAVKKLLEDVMIESAAVPVPRPSPLRWRRTSARTGRRSRISSRFCMEAAHSPGAGVPAVVAPAFFLPPCSGVPC